MDILNMSLEQIDKMEPIDYGYAVAYSWLAYNLRRVDLIFRDKKPGGDITYEGNEHDSKDYTRTPENDAIRRKRFEEFKERIKKKGFICEVPEYKKEAKK